MSEKYNYILRYCISPGCCEAERMDTLIEFCQRSKTEEVMFFVLPEELNTGHATLDELEPWITIIQEGKRRLSEIGVRTSINPWMTLLHCDRGRTLKPGQNFRTMVDIDGNVSSACACPLDEVWLDNLCACYAKFAELSPDVLWIEDDFRLHNHLPLNWGGCFCDEHMKRYSQLAGKELTRQEFVQAVCAQGDVHPLRKVWLDFSRETMLYLAKRISDAVFAVNPNITMGLMTSDPAVHSAEARDWHTLMNNLTGKNHPHVRIHLPAYGEVNTNSYGINFQYVSRYTKAHLPADIEIYPELENFPHTRYTKSCTFSRFQIETSAQIGASGITMNIYDMMGNGVLPGEKYQDMLAEIKDFMDMTRRFHLGTAENMGVEVLINPDASYTMESTNSSSITGLYPRERNFAGLFSPFSIANRYRIGTPGENSIIAVSNQYFSACTDDEITQLLSDHCAILDGDAVLYLKKRGLLHLISAEDASIILHDTNVTAYEEVCNGKLYAEIPRARISLQNACGELVNIRYREDANVEVMTMGCAAEGPQVAPATALVNNRILILPYSEYSTGWGGHLNTVRCELIKDALDRMNGTKPVYALDVPYLNVYHYDLGCKKVIALVNTSSDDYDEIPLSLPADLLSAKNVTLWSKTALEGRKVSFLRNGNTAILQESIPSKETIFLTFC